jgi:porin
MNLAHRAACALAAAALSSGCLFLHAAPARSENWDDDVRFVYCDERTNDTGPADDSDGAPPCTCEGYNNGCYCSGGGNYFSDLKQQLTCCMTQMQQCGVTYAAAATQFYQGVAEGGAEQDFEYGGKVDQFVILDSGKLGLWQGMTVNMHAETRFGDDVNFDAVGFAPANVAMLYPKSNEDVTAITGLTFTQAVDQDLAITFGKINALDLWYELYPQTGRGITGFMNTSMVIPLAIARVFSLSFMGAGATAIDDQKRPYAGVTVYDTHNVTTTSGFEDLGDNGCNILGYYRYYYNWNGLPGSHLFAGAWSTGNFTSFDPEGWVFIPGQGLVAPKVGGAFALFYIYEQTLWADCENPKHNLGVLSQWALSDQETSPVRWSGNVALQGTGMNRCRPDDAIGVGYFHTAISSNLENLLSPVINLHDVDGVELYYNAAISKCFHLTGDFQVIEPADKSNDTAIVVGLRGELAM